MAPSSQVGFFDFIVMPLYTTLAKAFPGTSELANQAHANYRSWRRMQQNGEEPSLQDIGGYELQMSRHRHLDTLQDEAQETHSFAAAS